MNFHIPLVLCIHLMSPSTMSRIKTELQLGRLLNGHSLVLKGHHHAVGVDHRWLNAGSKSETLAQ